MQYLILHKVRGEPAFDIAEPLQIGDEEGWIIPTSGHRAYPYEVWPLDKIPECLGDIHGLRLHTDFSDHPGEPSWLESEPDHYQEAELPAKKGNGISIDIGKLLSDRLAKFRRRI